MIYINDYSLSRLPRVRNSERHLTRHDTPGALAGSIQFVQLARCHVTHVPVMLLFIVGAPM
jgi:hypothetical protein